MKTLYAATLARLGLSLAEASGLHNVRLDTIKSWSSGRNPVPQGAWDDLRQYEDEIQERSEALREQWDMNPAAVEIDVSAADPASLMAAADFVLGLPEGTPVHCGQTDATIAARKARKQAMN